MDVCAITAERRRCAGPRQCDVIDDTIKSLNDDAALELFVCIIVALVAVVSCVRKTHIGCISVFLTLFTNTRLLRRFRPYPGRLLFEGRVAAPPGRHCAGSAAPRSSSPSTTPSCCWTTTQRAAGRRRSGLLGDDAAWLSLLQVWGVGTRSRRFSFLVFLFLWVERHMTLFGPSFLVFLFFQVGRRLLRRWCCAWAAAPGVFHRRSRVGELPRHTPQTHCSATPLVLVRDDFTTQVALRSSLSLIAVFVRCCSLCFFWFRA